MSTPTFDAIVIGNAVTEAQSLLSLTMARLRTDEPIEPHVAFSILVALTIADERLDLVHDELQADATTEEPIVHEPAGAMQ